MLLHRRRKELRRVEGVGERGRGREGEGLVWGEKIRSNVVHIDTHKLGDKMKGMSSAIVTY